MVKTKMLWQDGSKTAHISIERLSLGKLIGIKHFIKARPFAVEFYGFTRQQWNDSIFKEIGKRHSKCIGFILAQNDRKLEDMIVKIGIFDKQHLDKGRRIIQEHQTRAKSQQEAKSIELKQHITDYQNSTRTQRTIGELIKA